MITYKHSLQEILKIPRALVNHRPINIKLFLGKVFTRIGMLQLFKWVVNKLGYHVTYKDFHSNGIDLQTDISDAEVESTQTVFDVGASIGGMSDKFLNLFPAATIHAFEPFDPSFTHLDKKFGKHPRVLCNKLGLSSKPGLSQMFLQKDSGYNSLNERVNKPSKQMNGQYQDVHVSTIKEYCNEKNIKHIDFIKIDVEGLDLEVLYGAEEMLNAGMIKYIFIECTFDHENEQNTSFHSVNTYLQTKGFKVRSLYDQSNFGGKNYLTCVNALFVNQMAVS
jgi:FkbM family methyltransferase